MIIADGVPQVLAAVRQALKQGATQIKVLAGGGVSSPYDPLDANQFTFDELKAAVEAASDWGTYVTVHVYNSSSIQRAIAAGGKGIEHGHLVDEETAQLIAEKGVWLSIQPFQEGDPGIPELGPFAVAKYNTMAVGFDRVMNWAKKYRIKLAFGTDLMPVDSAAQGDKLARFSKYLSHVEILRMATSTNAEMFLMSGECHPYKEGPLGVIKPGAYADMLLVDGNPLEDLKLLGSNGQYFALIMKDGTIYKNTLK